MGTSENNRRAPFYRLTRADRKQLGIEESRWAHVRLAIATVVHAGKHRPEVLMIRLPVSRLGHRGYCLAELLHGAVSGLACVESGLAGIVSGVACTVSILHGAAQRVAGLAQRLHRITPLAEGFGALVHDVRKQ
jgi:hypothetical protein